MGRHFRDLVYNIKQDLEACSARVSTRILSASLLTEEVRSKFFKRLQHLQFSADHMPTAVDRLSRLDERQTWPVSYTHLDVYKRQAYSGGQCDGAPGVLVVGIQAAFQPVLRGHPGAEGVCILCGDECRRQHAFVREGTRDHLIGGGAAVAEEFAKEVAVQRHIRDVAVLLEGCLLYTSRCV